MSQENLTNKMTSCRNLQAEFDKILLMEDRNVVKLLMAFVISSRSNRDPLWLFLVGPSGGGKTEILNSINKLPYVHPVDTLTVNTLASGQASAGKETSLLLKINRGIMTFKDFTAILETNKEARREIMSQLRCVYDGEFVKRTGNGKDIKWKGKISVCAATTTVINQKTQEMASMGERFIQYQIAQPNRKDVQKRIFMNSHKMEHNRTHLQECVKEYIDHVQSITEDEDITLSEDAVEEIINLADFSATARSGLVVNERNGKIDFIPDPEMPTRITGQLISLAVSLATLNQADALTLDSKVPTKKILKKEDLEIIIKIALDSVPRKRRQVIQLMTKYRRGVTGAAAATALGYETTIINQTMYELTALKIANRVHRNDTYYYVLNDEHRKVIEEFEKIVPLDEDLSADSKEEEDMTDAQKDADDAFGAAFGDF